MADAAARREARRRRILENSQNRLQLISGKTSETSIRGSPQRTLDGDSVLGKGEEMSQSNWISEPFITNGVIVTEPSPNISLTPNTFESEVSTSIHSTGPLSFPLKSVEQKKNVPLWEKIIHSQYDIVMLSIIIQLVYSLTSMSVENHYFFMPFAVYVSTKMLLFPQPGSSRILDMLLLLNGLSSQKVQRFVFIAQFLAKFSQDVGLFMFTTICTQYFAILLKEQIPT